ncbi:hypothetical protein [Streptomyces azureus]|uniref:hypothetical protein n=1 Tax=Streptomyces azureus TaxID=146537 RepID=UPI000A9B4505|nr:hypothetical protein [Streptomyces azureus]
MSRTAARRWTRRITARVLAVGLVVAGLASLDRQEPSAPLAVESAAVSTNQVGVSPAPASTR